MVMWNSKVPYHQSFLKELTIGEWHFLQK